MIKFCIIGLIITLTLLVFAFTGFKFEPPTYVITIEPAAGHEFPYIDQEVCC